MTPRTARSPTREEAADENESEDDLLEGPRADEAGVPSRRRKESLIDVLQSDPPWSGQSMASAKESQSAQERHDVSALPPPRAGSLASNRVFSPIANMDTVSGDKDRPSQPNLAFRPSTAGSATSTGLVSAEQHALNDFPIPPPRQTTILVTPEYKDYSSSSSPSSVLKVDSATSLLKFPANLPKKLVPKDERMIRTEKHDDLIAFLQTSMPPPPPISLFTDHLSGLSRSEPATPTSTASSRKSRLGSFKQLLSSATAARPSATTLLSADGSSVADEFGRLPQIANIGRKLSKKSSFGSVNRGLSSSRRRDGSIVSIEALRAEMEIQEMDREVLRKKHREDQSPLISNMDNYEILRFTPSQHNHELPPAPPANGAPHPPLSAPPLTPEHLKNDLFGLDKSLQSTSDNRPALTPLDTPPATPQDKDRRLQFAATHNSTAEKEPASPTDSPIKSTLQHHASQIRRKAPPRLEEQLAGTKGHRKRSHDAVGFFPAERPRQMSIDAVIIAAEDQARRQSSPSVFPGSPSAGALRSGAVEQDIGEKTKSASVDPPRPIPPATVPKSLSPVLSTGQGPTDLHTALVSLRLSMQSATSVQACVSLIDAALHDIAGSTQSKSTIDEESSRADVQDAERDTRPALYSSQTSNRAYLALLEWLHEGPSPVSASCVDRISQAEAVPASYML